MPFRGRIWDVGVGIWETDSIDPEPSHQRLLDYELSDASGEALRRRAEGSRYHPLRFTFYHMMHIL